MGAGGEIGAALEAEIALKCGVSDQNWLAPLVDELRFLLISGDVSLEADDDAHEITVIASATKKAKCVRCWHHRSDVGKDRKRAVLGKRVSVRVDIGGRGRLKKKKT